MAETIADYMKRTLDLIADRDPLEVQRATAGTLRALLEGVPEAQLTKSPAPGKWSIAQILAHLADDEIVLGYRLRAVIAEPGCSLAGFDQDRWADGLRYHDIPARESLKRFEFVRAWNLTTLERLQDGEWEHHGIHSERGRESVRDMVRFYAGHDLNHLQQIRRILDAS